MRALVRGLASTFAQCITSEPLVEPIVLQLARKQHETYVALLQRLLPGGVSEVAADDRRPDCCFIEDTAVVVGCTAVVARIGAASRQGEEPPVAAALEALGCTVKRLTPPATLDGGDVLQLPGGTDILVGLSRRTNAAGVTQLAQHLGPAHAVHSVPVAAGLHLKSLLTALDSSTLLIADNPAGRALSAVLAAHPVLSQATPAAQHARSAGAYVAGGSTGDSASSSSGRPHRWQHVMVPDPVAANVLLLGDWQQQQQQQHVVMQAGCPASEALLEGLCASRGLTLHKLPRMTEFIKADGALTCCSILLPD